MSEDKLSGMPPVDYSFRHLVSSQDLDSLKVRGTRVRKTPEVGPNKKFISASLWLNNNNIRSTKEIVEMAEKLLEDPKSLKWLDLSFNSIDDIGDEISKFPKLRILYLHGNKINNLALMNKLKKISTLRTLTVHGNPIDRVPQYRVHMVNMLPQLSTLDFVNVLKSEKMIVAPVGYPEPGVKHK